MSMLNIFRKIRQSDELFRAVCFLDYCEKKNTKLQKGQWSVNLSYSEEDKMRFVREKFAIFLYY